MRDSATDVLTLFPEFEDQGTVESRVPIRIKTDPENGAAELLLREDLYDRISDALWLFNNDVFSIRADAVVAAFLNPAIPDISVTVDMGLFLVSIRCVGLVRCLISQAISVGKFAYTQVGFGENFGNAFGGGTIAREQ